MIDRITILGGSSVYTPVFMLSVISRNLNVKEIVLVGRPGPKLPIVAEFCQRLLDKSGFPSRVIPCEDVAEGVAGAKYVINNIRVGGMKARLRDEKAPPKHGMIGDESLGAGGFANAMRTLPVVYEYAKQIEEVNPDALFINLTNPMGVLVQALCTYTNLNVMGVCDLPGTYVRKVADVLCQDPASVWVDYVGLNHMGWIQDVKVNGRSLMPRVLERLEHHTNDGFDNSLIELFRMIPTSTVSLYFHQDDILKKQLSCSRFRAETLYEAEKQILRMYEDKSLNDVPELTHERNAVWYDETIVPLIEALESRDGRDIILCVRNDGAVRDLPDACSVEIPVKVSAKGLKPRKVGNCPHFLAGLFQAVTESNRLTIEAAHHRSYDYALQALTIDPLVPSLDAAKRFLDCVIKDEQIELH